MCTVAAVAIKTIAAAAAAATVHFNRPLQQPESGQAGRTESCL